MGFDRLPERRAQLNSRSFGLCVASMIMFNSILLGLDVNRNKAVLEEQATADAAWGSVPRNCRFIMESRGFCFAARAMGTSDESIV